MKKYTLLSIPLILLFAVWYAFADGTTTNMSLTKPSVGVVDSTSWGTKINTNLDLIDAHDHSSGKGGAISTDEITVSSITTESADNILHLSTNTTVHGDLAVTGNQTIGDDLTVVDDTLLGSLRATGGAIIDTTLSVSTITTNDDNYILFIDTETVLNHNLEVSSGVVVGGAVTVSSDSVSLVTPLSNTLYSGNIISGWVNFNGAGTIAIRDSFNVSSIQDNGTGYYTVFWDVDFSTGGYCVVGNVGTAASNNILSFYDIATGYCSFKTTDDDGTLVDSFVVSIMAIGRQ